METFEMMSYLKTKRDEIQDCIRWYGHIAGSILGNGFETQTGCYIIRSE